MRALSRNAMALLIEIIIVTPSAVDRSTRVADKYFCAALFFCSLVVDVRSPPKYFILFFYKSMTPRGALF